MSGGLGGAEYAFETAFAPGVGTLSEALEDDGESKSWRGGVEVEDGTCEGG